MLREQYAVGKASSHDLESLIEQRTILFEDLRQELLDEEREYSLNMLDDFDDEERAF